MAVGFHDGAVHTLSEPEIIRILTIKRRTRSLAAGSDVNLTGVQFGEPVLSLGPLT